MKATTARVAYWIGRNGTRQGPNTSVTENQGSGNDNCPFRLPNWANRVRQTATTGARRPRPGRPRITGAQDRHGASSKPQLVANVAKIEAQATATVHSGLARADGTRRAVDSNLKGSDPRQKQALEQPRHPLELTAPCWKRRQCRARRLSGGASAPQRRRHGDLVSAS